MVLKYFIKQGAIAVELEEHLVRAYIPSNEKAEKMAFSLLITEGGNICLRYDDF